MITRYGRDVVLTELAVATLVSFSTWALTDNLVVRAIVWGVVVLFTLFTLYFFRDPHRTVPAEALGRDDMIVSPGDGKVIKIVQTVDNGFFHGPVTQISVFLSPLNVHVNRMPVTGTVKYFKYVKGEYLVAFHEKASEKNERTEIGIDTGRAKVVFKQIAGYVARRIVCPVKEGDHATIGERFGMIKFGSRVDILMSPESEVRVKLGDVVVGGETIVGILK